MSTNHPFRPSFFVPRPSSLVPVYHWRGARPWLLDLEPHESGWLIALCLGREGDVCLLPLAWQASAPGSDNPPGDWPPFPTPYTQALDNTAVAYTLNHLQQDGWHVNGRLTLQFIGADTEPNFQETIHHYLWHTPGENTPDEA